MSVRLKPGNVVIKHAGAGFLVETVRCVLPNIEDNKDVEPCQAIGSGCNDLNCRSWPTLWVLDENNKPDGGSVYHVSECEVTLLPGVKVTEEL